MNVEEVKNALIKNVSMQNNSNVSEGGKENEKANKYSIKNFKGKYETKWTSLSDNEKKQWEDKGNKMRDKYKNLNPMLTEDEISNSNKVYDEHKSWAVKNWNGIETTLNVSKQAMDIARKKTSWLFDAEKSKAKILEYSKQIDTGDFGEYLNKPVKPTEQQYETIVNDLIKKQQTPGQKMLMLAKREEKIKEKNSHKDDVIAELYETYLPDDRLMPSPAALFLDQLLKVYKTKCKKGLGSNSSNKKLSFFSDTWNDKTGSLKPVSKKTATMGKKQRVFYKILNQLTTLYGWYNKKFEPSSYVSKGVAKLKRNMVNTIRYGTPNNHVNIIPGYAFLASIKGWFNSIPKKQGAVNWTIEQNPGPNLNAYIPVQNIAVENVSYQNNNPGSFNSVLQLKKRNDMQKDRVRDKEGGMNTRSKTKSEFADNDKNSKHNEYEIENKKTKGGNKIKEDNKIKEKNDDNVKQIQASSSLVKKIKKDVKKLYSDNENVKSDNEYGEDTDHIIRYIDKNDVTYKDIELAYNPDTKGISISKKTKNK